MAERETPKVGKQQGKRSTRSPASDDETSAATGTELAPLPASQVAKAVEALKRVPDASAVWMHLDDPELRRWESNPRNNDANAPRVADSIEHFGFVAPIVVWKGRLVAGDTRIKGMRLLMARRPDFIARGAPGPGYLRVVFHDFANEEEANLYALADNRLNELSEWDSKKRQEILARYDENDRKIAGYEPEVVKADALEVRNVDVEALAQETFWLMVRGPLPAQPDVLEKLRDQLRGLDGVEVQFGAG